MNTDAASPASLRPAVHNLTRPVLIIGLLAATGFFAGLVLDLHWLRLVTKPIPVLCLMIWLRFTARGRYATLLLAGLAFSLLGDVVLEASDSLFVPGLLAFLVAHLWYIAAFLSATRRLALLRALPFAAWGVGAYLTLQPNLGGMAAPVGAYVVVICSMMWRASARVGEGGAARSDQWAALIGAILFALSDTLIALNRFNAPIAGARYAIIGLYWLGQSGLSLSARRG